MKSSRQTVKQKLFQLCHETVKYPSYHQGEKQPTQKVDVTTSGTLLGQRGRGTPAWHLRLLFPRTAQNRNGRVSCLLAAHRPHTLGAWDEKTRPHRSRSPRSHSRKTPGAAWSRSLNKAGRCPCHRCALSETLSGREAQRCKDIIPSGEQQTPPKAGLSL